MKIAICDDDHTEIERTMQLVFEFDKRIKPVAFNNAEAIMRTINHEITYDLIFMDIWLGSEMNGFNAAQLIKKQYNGLRPLIVLSTISEDKEHLRLGYNFAWRYLNKPLKQDEVLNVLSDADALLKSDIVTLRVEGVERILHMTDIMYAETHNVNLTIATKRDGILVTRISLEEFGEKLSSRMFGCPHRGYLVNFKYIKKIDNRTIIIDDGNMIPLSRNNRKEFCDRHKVFMRGEG